MTDQEQSESLGYILSRTYLTYKKAAAKSIASCGITPDQYGIMHCLNQKEGISQKLLAELHVRDQTAVSKIIDKLEQKKLILRTSDPRDRRAVLLYLTQEGKQLVEQLKVYMEQTEKQELAQLSDSETERFINTINTIFRNLHE